MARILITPRMGSQFPFLSWFPISNFHMAGDVTRTCELFIFLIAETSHCISVFINRNGFRAEVVPKRSKNQPIKPDHVNEMDY